MSAKLEYLYIAAMGSGVSTDHLNTIRAGINYRFYRVTVTHDRLKLQASRSDVWTEHRSGWLFPNEGLCDMRNHFNLLAILVAALLASTASVVAQTGEFASPVPGSVVHQGYELQDWWQNQWNRARVSPLAAAEPQQAESSPVKPRHVRPKHPQ